MKNLLLHITIIILSFSSIIAFSQKEKQIPGKKALIIAVGDYQKETGWMVISSGNDVPLIRGALLKQGFKDADIRELKDTQATKQGILDAFAQFTASVKPGDVVVVHYSGHGQQVADQGEQDEADGLDESLVPFDAQVRFVPGVYEGQNHLTDDEMNEFLTGLRAKLGPEGNVLVILDACHSGTGTRGFNKARGTDEVMASPEYLQSIKEGGTGNEQDMLGSRATTENLAPMVVFSGASADELNYETTDESGNGVGSLSYAFSRSMATSGTETTYRTLFDKIKVDMLSYAPRQEPQVEGDLDRQILGGRAVPFYPYFVPSKFYDEKTLALDAGQLAGLFDSTRMALYPMDATDFSTATPKATGTIAYSDLISSEVYLDTPLAKADALNSKVVVTVPAYGSMKVKVKVDIQDNPGLTAALQEEMAEVPVIELAGNNEPFDLLVELNNEYTKKTRGANFLQFSTAQDQLLLTHEVMDVNPALLAGQIVDYSIDYARAQYMKELEMQDTKMKVTFTIHPYDIELRGSRIQGMTPLPIEQFTDASGALTFGDSTFFKLKFRNEGKKDVYYTVLDIRNDNSIDVLVPWDGTEPEDFILKPGEEYETEAIFLFKEPFGNEMFKVIATTDPLDLRPLITANRGDSPKGGLNPLEQLVQDAGRGTRATAVGTSVGSANVESIVLKVVK